MQMISIVSIIKCATTCYLCILTHVKCFIGYTNPPLQKIKQIKRLWANKGPTKIINLKTGVSSKTKN